MGAERPVPQDGVMDQETQAALVRATGDGVPVTHESKELTAEWGEPDGDGVYGRNLEAERVYGGEQA